MMFITRLDPQQLTIYFISDTDFQLWQQFNSSGCNWTEDCVTFCTPMSTGLIRQCWRDKIAALRAALLCTTGGTPSATRKGNNLGNIKELHRSKQHHPPSNEKENSSKKLRKSIKYFREVLTMFKALSKSRPSQQINEQS
jgi:hypothetical protein